jgi:hypothetical protein
MPGKLLAAPGCPPHGEELIAAPIQQQGLGVQRLSSSTGQEAFLLTDPAY